MYYLLRLSQKITGDDTKKLSRVFLSINMTVALMIGFFLWLAFRVTVGGTMIGLICSMGYSMVFLGALGGILYLMNNDLW